MGLGKPFWEYERFNNNNHNNDNDTNHNEKVNKHELLPHQAQPQKLQQFDRPLVILQYSRRRNKTRAKNSN